MKRSINLGLTDQKCDQYEIVNLVRGIKPSLIATTTNNRNLDKDVLLVLADLLLFLYRKILPTTNFHDSFPMRDGPMADLLCEFAKQLGVTREEDISDFRFPGAAVILPDMLMAHRDLMNPKNTSTDVTVQMNASLEIELFPPEIQQLIRLEFGSKVKQIPVSILVYPRRCLFGYEQRIGCISNYVDMNGASHNSNEAKGRKNIVEVMSDVGSTLDYNSRFLSQSGFNARESECSYGGINDVFDGKYNKSPAAVDKMVSDVKNHPSVYSDRILTIVSILAPGLVVCYPALFWVVCCQTWNITRGNSSIDPVLFTSMQLYINICAGNETVDLF